MFNLSFIFVIILALAGGTGYMYYQNSQEEKAVLIAEAAINNTKIVLQQQALRQADSDLKRINKIIKDLENKFKRSQEDYDNLVLLHSVKKRDDISDCILMNIAYTIMNKF